MLYDFQYFKKVSKKIKVRYFTTLRYKEKNPGALRRGFLFDLKFLISYRDR